MTVIQSIARDAVWKRLEKRLPTTQGVVHVSGVWGSAAPMTAGILARDAKRLHLYITPHLEQADNARDDLELFLGAEPELLPAWEALPGEGAACGEIEAERLRLCTSVRRHLPGERTGVIVTPIQALMQPVPTPEALEQNTLRIAVHGRTILGTPATPDTLVSWAIARSFERLELVESPGDVARRGDIVDLFPPGERSPYRIQFLDDEIESIRTFDVGTQRSVEAAASLAITVLDDPGWTTGAGATDFADYLPPGSLVILDEPGEIQTVGETIHARLGGGGLFSVADVLARLSRFPALHLSSFAPAATRDEAVFDLGVRSLARFEGEASDAVRELCDMTHHREVHVVCDSEGERKRLLEMIAEQAPEAKDRVHTHIGVLHRGFEWTATETLVVPHHEVFHRHRQRRRLRRLHAGRPLESWLDLKPGACVVHVVHGIAIYRGLKRMRKGDSEQQEEFLKLEFASKTVVYVPCSQIDLVQKYIGSGGRNPELSKIGGRRWSTTKERVAEAVSDLAESLLRVQALRDRAAATAYPADTPWQREFEAAFAFEETEDQLIVAGDIRADLMRSRPMDRLVCGDVGYGKTELAMRAAFKVVEYGRQAAVLVPTTVLAEQHYATFRQRLGDYPFNLACLSRFRSGGEQKKIIDRLKKGQVDIVIGTHRLLSDDVSIPNLGLLIIDEEQRFGVEHKERLKAMRETVEMLTLTATPIPRTLHMSMMGLRDISSLQTPPIDRRAIATRVGPFNDDLIRNAILRELNREGQVYFVHNFVKSIAAMADTVARIVPEARVLHAHGQMKDDELESVMHRFVRREADVLVTTTIIESGLDIPSANTIFINRADRFGLADLHQLRGRVGRSSHRAYCYLLLAQDRPPTAKAAKRLKTIEEFSELGAGFRIAMRDLEIRGAGNLLGSEQSGHIAAVGYDLYCRLLDQTVRRLKNEPDPNPPPVHVDLEVAASVPRQYVSADRLRIEVYRRIVACRTEEELAALERDLLDTFGRFPDEVRRLLELAEIRVHARAYGIVSISLKRPDLVFAVRHLAKAEPMFVDARGTVRMPDARTIHWRPPANYLEPATLVTILRRMMIRANSRVETTV